MKKLLLLLVLSISSAQAVFVSCEVWKNSQGQTVVCLGDLHDSRLPFAGRKVTYPHSMQQIHDLHVLCNRNRDTTHVILEDMQDYGKKHQGMLSQWINSACNTAFPGTSMSFHQFLNKLLKYPDALGQTETLKQQGFSVYNAECRRSDANPAILGPSITTCIAHADDIIKECQNETATAGCLRNYCEASLSKVREKRERLLQYIDGVVSNTHFDDHLSHEQRKNNFMITHTAGCLLNCLKYDTNQQSDVFTYDAELVDIRIAQNIQQSQAQTIIVCAGDAHVRQLKPALEALGYSLKHCLRDIRDNGKGTSTIEIVDINKELTAFLPESKKSDDTQKLFTPAYAGLGSFYAYKKWQSTNNRPAKPYQQPMRARLSPQVLPHNVWRMPAMSLHAKLSAIMRLLKR